MPWNQNTQMEEITRFVILAQSDRYTLTELCEQFGISRKNGYKHLGRYATAGLPGLAMRSHRPHQFPQRTTEQVEALILAERRLHRTWGPKKLHKVLQMKHGLESPPAQSTIGEILRRHGQSVIPRRSPGVYHSLNAARTEPTQPNEVWTVDFKGWFSLGDGQRCDPLTVCDRYSRYRLCCKACPNQQFIGTLHGFKDLMRYRGLTRDGRTLFSSIIHRQLGLHLTRFRPGVVSTFKAMPNQLSKTKRRQSLAEHEGVLAALAEIARFENTTVMALLRQATRDLVKRKVREPAQLEKLRQAVWGKAPRMLAHFKTVAQVARFKRAQREFDQVLLDLALASPQAIQQRNSIVSPRRTIRMIDFDQVHAAAAV